MHYDRGLVLKKVGDVFPGGPIDEALEILDKYGSEQWEEAGERVHLAILKLSKGSLDPLKELIKLAKLDPRDVIAHAEYPEFSKLGFSGVDKLSASERAALIERDRRQYEQWLFNSVGQK
jgi:hypothetical protein